MPYYEEAGITIYHANCLDVLPTLPKVDLVLTDPPYGINAVQRFQPGATQYEAIIGDDSELDLAHLFAIDAEKVIFGANCFPNQLPHRGRWLVWDKRVDPACDAMLGSPFELAWTSRTSGFEWIARIQHGGVVNADQRYHMPRWHPTQKPIALMSFCLLRFPGAALILDPYCGSGTTLVAAKNLGRRAIGIEIEERYCEIAVNRLRQGVLWGAE